MSITLKKNETFNLSKKEPTLKKILIGLGWEKLSGNTIDLDASVFMIGKNGKLPADSYFIFYNNLKSPDGAVQHTGDNRSGIGEGDDEMILVNLPLIHADVSELIFVVTIHEAEERRHHFGLLKDAYIRLVDVETNREILNYDIDLNNSNHTDLEFARLQKNEGEWKFFASGAGSNHGLQGFVDIYA